MFTIESILGDAGAVTALAVIGGLIFLECGLLVGLFVPGGDVLLIASGVFAAEDALPLAGVLIVIFVAATVGYEVGYIIGAKTGPKIFSKPKGIFFRKEYADRAARFYEHHGGKMVFIARFLGYIRTLAPLMAGIAKMPRGKFIFYNVTGALLWTLMLVMIGYWFGSEFADTIKDYALPLMIAGLVLFGGILILHLIKHKQAIRR